MAWPREERAPRIHWIADLRRQKESRHRIHERVEEYDSFHFSARRAASLINRNGVIVSLTL